MMELIQEVLYRQRVPQQRQFESLRIYDHVSSNMHGDLLATHAISYLHPYLFGARLQEVLALCIMPVGYP